MEPKDAHTFLAGSEIDLSPPEEFHFPFPPYEIQKDFMTQLYIAMEKKKLGIFESPTGTGKSLSLICGALSWLRDHEERITKHLESALKSLEAEKAKYHDGGGDWLTAQVKRSEIENVARTIRQKIDRINRKEKKISDIRLRARGKNRARDVPIVSTLHSTEAIDEIEKPEDDDILLEDFLEDPAGSDQEDQDEIEDEPPVRIIFCSRTHSQLSQFIGEIQRTTFSESMRVVPLGSRQNCCINKTVKKLSSLSLMNEKCLDMLKSSEKNKDPGSQVVKKAKSSTTCPHLKRVESLSDVIVSNVLDLEGIVRKGESMSACPYYATRAATTHSQVVVVPYNTLLHKSTRESSKLQIKNSVIIIDEAHNLLETVSHIHSSEVTGQQITYAMSQLMQYKSKFEKRFSSMNLLLLSQLIFVLKCLTKFIAGRVDNPNDGDSKLYTVSDFILSAGIDNYNLFSLVDFCTKNKIIHKIRGYAEKYQPTLGPKPKTEKLSGMKSFLNQVAQQKTKINVEKEPKRDENVVLLDGQPLVPTLAFLSNLTMDYKEGRVVVTRNEGLGRNKMKYLLLDPATVMRDIIQEARSVVLAGGTMKPFSEFRDRLFIPCGADESRILEFSCGHVIPKDNILPIILSSGPSEHALDFTFQKRNSESLMAEIGRLLVNVCSVVPSGIVCFFPSYEYENRVYNFLDKNDYVKKLSSKKKLFREPKTSSQVEAVLKEYAEAAKNKSRGALMFSVVGGKLSEGLNFSDDLGRCVIVVGMPYPNITSPELKEKMNFLNQTVGPHAGREYYENCCMKAVNQCIGRAVRHREDYSTVLLLDQRYKSPHTIALLPQWISKSLVVQDKFGPVLGLLAKFFKGRR